MRIFLDELRLIILMSILGVFGLSIYHSVHEQLKTSRGMRVYSQNSTEKPLILKAEFRNLMGAVNKCVIASISMVKMAKSRIAIRNFKNYVKSGQIFSCIRIIWWNLHEAGSDLKSVCTKFIDALYRYIGKMMLSFKNKEVRRRIVFDALAATIVSTALVILSGKTDGGSDLYMTTYLPMLGIVIFFLIFTEIVHGPREFTFRISLLILLGDSLQVMLAHFSDNAIRNVGKMAVLAWIAMGFAIVALPLLIGLIKGLERNKVIRYVTYLLAALYALLAIAGKTVNSARCWINIGPLSLQITEITKLISVYLFGLCFTNISWSSNYRLYKASIILGINAACLIAFNELGTLVLIGIVFVLLAFLYLPSVKELLIVLLLGGMMILSFLVVTHWCYQTIHKEQQVEMTSQESLNQQEVNSTPVRTTNNKAVKLGSLIWNKIYTRVVVVLKPDEVDVLNEGYQMNQARKAVLLARWFGSAYDVTISVADSDYVFAYLLLKMGIIPGLIILFMILRILLSVGVNSMRIPNLDVSAVSVGFIITITIGSLIAAASASNILPTVGIPFAFLAKGGSANMVNYTMVMFVIFANGDIEVKENSKRRIERMEV